MYPVPPLGVVESTGSKGAWSAWQDFTQRWNWGEWTMGFFENKNNIFFLIASTITEIILSEDPEVVAVREKIFTNRREWSPGTDALLKQKLRESRNINNFLERFIFYVEPVSRSEPHRRSSALCFFLRKKWSSELRAALCRPTCKCGKIFSKLFSNIASVKFFLKNITLVKHIVRFLILPREE